LVVVEEAVREREREREKEREFGQLECNEANSCFEWSDVQAREIHDDGMVPFNLFLVRNLFSGIIIKYRVCEYRRLIKMIEE